MPMLDPHKPFRGNIDKQAGILRPLIHGIFVRPENNYRPGILGKNFFRQCIGLLPRIGKIIPFFSFMIGKN